MKSSHAACLALTGMVLLLAEVLERQGPTHIQPPFSPHQRRRFALWTNVEFVSHGHAPHPLEGLAIAHVRSQCRAAQRQQSRR